MSDIFEFMVTETMREERLRREELFELLFAGRPVPHIPIEIKVHSPKYKVREHYFDREKQLEDALESARLTWTLEKNDLIPSLFPDVGCSCMATIFGAEYYFGENENQTAGVKEFPVRNLEKWASGAVAPDVMESKWIREGIERIRIFAEAGKGFMPVNGLDAAGGVNVAADLLGVGPLLLAMIDEKEALHKMLSIIQDTYLALIAKEVEAAGGTGNMTCVDFYPGWCPEGYKGHCSDDISAMFGPEMYEEFSAPYSAMIYEKYGPGGLHNCGPNPCHEAYVSHLVSPRYIDLNETYSEADLPALKKSLKRKAFLRWTSEETDIDIIEKKYRSHMELLAPDVILAPSYVLPTVELGDAVYERLYPISVEYAKRVDYGFD